MEVILNNELPPLTVIEMYRVVKKSGLRIMYAKIDDKVFGGMRYSEDNNEELIKYETAQLAIEGMLRDDRALDYHESLGRKVEELGCVLIGEMVF